MGKIRTIGVLTSGGDASGMNAAIRAVVRTAIYNGLKVYGIKRGYKGLMNGEVEEMTASSVGGIINRGGTILFTARAPEFKEEEGKKKALETIERYNIDALVVIGGDGSFRGAHEFCSAYGIRVIGIPGTIDNDIEGTDYTIGYDTAVNVAVEAIDKIRDTALSHERLFLVEVMGRHAGYIAIEVGLASGAEAVLIPEIEQDISEVVKKIMDGRKRGKRSSIIVVAEGASVAKRIYEFALLLEELSGYEVRVSVLGHIQRGGSPTALDRIYATKLGWYAVELLLKGETDKMVGMKSNQLVYVPLQEAFEKKKFTDVELLKMVDILAI